jgi:hypothetical protein
LDGGRINWDKYGENLGVILFVICSHLIFCRLDFGVCQKIGVVVGGKIVESAVGKGISLGGASRQKNNQKT